MGRRRIKPLVIHKSEWKRLQCQANPVQEPEKPSCKVDIQALNEKSQQWKRTWPDTVEGHVHRVSLKMKEKAAKDLAEIETFKNRPKYDNSAVIKHARQLIFERSNYGQLLTSAVAESKALEEREVQIKFKKQIKEEAKRLEEAQAEIKNIMYAEFEKGDVTQLLAKQRFIDNAEFNKAIAKIKAENASKAAEIEKMHRKEDMKVLEKLRQLEILEQNSKPCLDKEGVMKYEAETKLIKERRARREILDQDLADIWKKYYERIRCKEEQMLRQIHREKHNSERFKDAHETVRRAQEEGEEKYNDFIEKGVNECKKRLQKREKEEEQRKEKRRQEKTKQALSNKVDGDNQKVDRAHSNKCVCDRQTILRRPKPAMTCDLPAKIAPELPRSERKPSFLRPRPAPAARDEPPAGWSGTAAAHAQFARAAGAALAECRYKLPVTRVIQEYRDLNGVKDLPIPN